MCTLLNLCVPIELRYLGTCLEHLGKRDFHDLRSSEAEANNPAELSAAFDGLALTSQHLRDKLAVYISLLHSCNYASSAAAYKILTKTDDLSLALKSQPDDSALDDLLLLYTLALSHPAFSSEQKFHLEKISAQLVEEERRSAKKHATNSAQQAAYAQDVEKAAVVPQLQVCITTCRALIPLIRLTFDDFVSQFGIPIIEIYLFGKTPSKIDRWCQPILWSKIWGNVPRYHSQTFFPTPLENPVFDVLVTFTDINCCCPINF